MSNKAGLLSVVLAAVLLVAMPVYAETWSAPKWRGQTVHVPVYSHVYYGNKESRFALATTLSVRNSSAEHTIVLEEVSYLDSEGKVVHRFIKDEVNITALAGVRFVVAENDLSGGSSARFIVRWSSKSPVPAPIIEGVMIGTASSQGISFVTGGVPLEGRK
ncbi:DUF3124 domain-containing protein [Oleidesulfovibrio sp.]|uniref:DUF3124 domain-containing protein n=1 Tax=Oleidesulfovibrio sp. TaxID=2909707 RepID=UPI003A8A92C1